MPITLGASLVVFGKSTGWNLQQVDRVLVFGMIAQWVPLIVEDQTLMRQGLKTILDLESGLGVVGEAVDGKQGVHMALTLRPDVILMDVENRTQAADIARRHGLV